LTRTLVLLHGMFGGPWSYDGVLGALAQPRNLLVPTLSYHGATRGAPLPDVDYLEEVERLAGQIAETCSAPVDLVGYSLGGRLALGLSVAHPQLVRRLLLVSSRRGLESQLERDERQRADEHWARLLESEGLDAFFERWWTQPLFASLSRLPKETLHEELVRRKSHDPSGLAAALRRLGLGKQPSYLSEARNLRLPVTLLAGALDEKYLALSAQLASELPLGRCVVVEQAGHHLLLEAPCRVAQIIDEETER
jgi:2-succinyl-6-hydroxy-2,4-cyclohexadiene-1-carboxylate synthase